MFGFMYKNSIEALFFNLPIPYYNLKFKSIIRIDIIFIDFTCSFEFKSLSKSHAIFLSFIYFNV